MKNDVAPIVYSIICAARKDDYDLIRVKAVRCLMLISDSKYQDKVTQGLYDAIIDPSARVRNMVANLCINNKIHESDLRSRLLEVLSKDANYLIRTRVKSALKEEND